MIRKYGIDRELDWYCAICLGKIWRKKRALTSGKERYILAALYKYYDECILKNERKENNKIDNMVYIPYNKGEYI